MPSSLPDVTTMSQEQLNDYRHELINALNNPGSEFEADGEQGEQDQKLYASQLALASNQLNTFPGAPLGGTPSGYAG